MQYKQDAARAMSAILANAEGRSLTDTERKELQKLEKQSYMLPSKPDPDTRGVKAAAPERSVKGYRNELLDPSQSVSEWGRLARENRAIPSDGTGRDVERYWREMCGFSTRSVESRTLEEDIASGAGAAQAFVPQVWTEEFIDLLRAKLVLSEAGMRTLPMTTEIYKMPQWLDDVAPVWLAEGATNSLDANPQTQDVTFNVTGSYQDITLISRQALEDASAGGGLGDVVQQTIAEKYARLVESVVFYGTSGNVGNVGLVNTTGVNTVWVSTNGSAPTDSTPFSIAAETTRNANAEPTAFITNPSLAGTFARLNASTYANFWKMPPDVDQLPILSTTTIVDNESHGTGTNLSSFYTGPWQYVILGVRNTLGVTVLRERYADLGCIGFWSWMRFSAQVTQPQTFVKYGGFITT